MSSSSENLNKRQKISERKHDNDRTEAEVGPEDLDNWVSKASTRFSPYMRPSLLSSPNITSIHILQFVLKYVFNWSRVEMIELSEFDNMSDHRYNGFLEREGRVRALAFVTEWLGRDAPGENSSKIPSLARLGAQRIAMEVFHAFVEDLDCHIEEKDLDWFMGAHLRSVISSSLTDSGVPEYVQEVIMEEIFIFYIVHLLYIDIRTMTVPPTESLVPISYADIVRAPRSSINAVGNHGRGTLAKAGLLPYAVFKHYTHSVSQWHHYGDFGISMINKMFCLENGSLAVQHPFALYSALAPITSLIQLHCTIDYDIWGPSERVVGEILMLWISRWHKMQIRTKASTASQNDRSFTLLRLASKTPRPIDMKFTHMPPLKLNRNTIYQVVQDFIDVIDSKEFCSSYVGEGYYNKYSYYPNTSGASGRFRLNGNYSKEEILRAAMICSGATFVDLQECRNLDEECLGAILHCLTHVEIILLKGTSVNKECDTIKNAIKKKKRSKKNIDFVFAEDACKVQGHKSQP